MLKRFGFPTRSGRADQISGQLEWPGAPSDFEPDVLSGTLDIDVGAGQFTKIDPGIGKLLGVLSLQALPRRLTLDFRDVFSEGFAFDTIAGKTTITKGVMATGDLRLAGPAARVDISGEADLAKETQRLNVRVLPSLSSTFSGATAAGALLLLAANPLVAAAVGAGTLLAQKVMKDPLEQMFATTTGSADRGATRSSSASARARRQPRQARRPPPRVRNPAPSITRRNDARVSRRRRATVSGGEVAATCERNGSWPTRSRSARSSCCCPSTSAASARIRPTRSASPSATATDRSRPSSRARRARTASS
jgi:hypothetical protein